MAKKWHIAALTLALLTYPVGWAAAGPAGFVTPHLAAKARPTLPPMETLAAERPGYCGLRPVNFMGFNLSGSPEYLEVKVFGEYVQGVFEPRLWLFYPEGDHNQPTNRVVLTLANGVVIETTFAGLLKMFPNDDMCDVLDLKVA